MSACPYMRGLDVCIYAVCFFRSLVAPFLNIFWCRDGQLPRRVEEAADRRRWRRCGSKQAREPRRECRQTVCHQGVMSPPTPPFYALCFRAVSFFLPWPVHDVGVLVE